MRDRRAGRQASRPSPCDDVPVKGDAAPLLGPGSGLCVPKTSSTSCDQSIFVDQATDATLFPDAALVEVGRFG